MQKNDITLKDAVESYIEEIEMTNSANTVKAYKNGIRMFLKSVEKRGLTEDSPLSDLDQTFINVFVKYLRSYSPGTEALYLTAVKGFFDFLSESGSFEYSPAKMKKLLKNKARHVEKRIPSFSVQMIEKIIEYAERLPDMECSTTRDELIQKRDAAFIITLADTGMRVNEACNLYIRDIDQYQRKATVTGIKGELEAVRMSARSLSYINLYLDSRTEALGTDGKVYAALPVFAAHDKKSGTKLKAITPKTGRQIIKQYVVTVAGPGAAGSITPSSFRHYFVSKVLEKTGDMELTQTITRTSSPVIIKRYTANDSSRADDEYSKLFDYFITKTCQQSQQRFERKIR